MGNAKAALAYLFGLIGGIIVFLIAKDDQFSKFSAVQSILLSITLGIISMIASMVSVAIAAFTMGLGLLLMPLIWLIIIVVMLYMTYTGWTEKKVVLPFIGNLAEKWSA